jgi:hypothetical protein
MTKVSALPGRSDNPGVTVTVPWEEKEVFCRQSIQSKKKSKLFLDYLDFRANGGKTVTFMRDRGIAWGDISDIYHHPKVGRELWGLVKASERRGEELRQRLREDEADRRAVDGTKRPVFYKGQIVGHVTEYSDQMLALTLKAGDPDKYADHRNVKHSGAVLQMHISGVEREVADEIEFEYVEDGSDFDGSSDEPDVGVHEQGSLRGDDPSSESREPESHDD